MVLVLLLILCVARSVETQPSAPAPSVAFSLGYCLFVFGTYPSPSMAMQRRIADARLLIAGMRGEAEADKGYEEARADVTANRENSQACARQCGQKKWTDSPDPACYKACRAKIPKTYTGSARSETCFDNAWWSRVLTMGGLQR